MIAYDIESDRIKKESCGVSWSAMSWIVMVIKRETVKGQGSLKKEAFLFRFKKLWIAFRKT